MIDQLPPEIVELIISNAKLTIEDVSNCSQTCTTLHEIVLNSSFIWKHKYKQKWPQFMNLFDKNFNDWFKEVRYIYMLKIRTHMILSTMSARFYKKNELSSCDLEEWENLMRESPRAYEYIVLDLMTIIHCYDAIKSIQIVPVEKRATASLPNWCAEPTADVKWENVALQMDELAEQVWPKRQGLPITLAIIYESVARRVGLKCEPINFPAHFLLRFTEGRKDRPGNLLQFLMFSINERMANNLEVSCRQQINPHGNVTPLRSALELCHLINPQELSTVVNLARVYMWHNIDTKRLENFLLTRGFGRSQQEQQIINMLRDYDLHLRHNFSEPLMPIEPKARPNNLLYAVGMVMRHLVFNYICVIYDWDRVCSASAEWQQQMGVHKLRLKDQQPFYNVLVEDGSQRYVAQENMVSTDNTGFLYLNEDLGRFFSHFFETHYVPNAEKEKEFPADTDVRHMYHKKLKGLQ
ncbi:hypothetical protein FQR65_LT19010 [Abscondita terminalis]|nr:hypothetical protein FQR65_LT19010 [Abscondita terminalis]